MMKSALTLFLILASLSVGNLIAQEQTSNANREIGIRMTNFNNFGLMYKKQRSETNYFRLRAISTNLGFRFNPAEFGTFNVGTALGYEKRKAMSDQLFIYHGWEGIISAQTQFAAGPATFGIFPGVGFVMGMQYQVNPVFSIGLETIPTISANIGYDGFIWRVNGVNLGMNSSALALNFLFRF